MDNKTAPTPSPSLGNDNGPTPVVESNDERNSTVDLKPVRPVFGRDGEPPPNLMETPKRKVGYVSFCVGSFLFIFFCFVVVVVIFMEKKTSLPPFSYPIQLHCSINIYLRIKLKVTNNKQSNKQNKQKRKKRKKYNRPNFICFYFRYSQDYPYYHLVIYDDSPGQWPYVRANEDKLVSILCHSILFRSMI